MIKVQNLSPSVYYNRSRDFQLLGRLLDVMFNYIKSNTDSMANFPCNENVDDRMLDLMCYTLGIKKQHNYVSSQLRDICNVFVEIVRNKGSINGIKRLISTILHSNKVASNGNEVIFNESTNELNIYLDNSISDYSLINDILDYILPVGITYTIYKGKFKEYTFETIVGDEIVDSTAGSTRKSSFVKTSSITEESLLISGAVPRREDLLDSNGKVDVSSYNSMTIDNETITIRTEE